MTLPLTPQLEADVLHAQVLADLLEQRWADLGVTYPVYRDAVPDDLAYGQPDAYPYAVIWSAVGLPDLAAERLARWGGEITTTNQITYAGLTSAEVLGAAGRGRLALHMHRPAAGSRRYSVVKHDSGAGRPAPDPEHESGGQRVLSLATFVTLRSRPNRV